MYDGRRRVERVVPTLVGRELTLCVYVCVCVCPSSSKNSEAIF
jgi:hypothetical protein